jgi:hypothetical protein
MHNVGDVPARDGVVGTDQFSIEAVMTERTDAHRVRGHTP